MKILIALAAFTLFSFATGYSQVSSRPHTFKGRLIRNGSPMKRELVTFVNYGTAVTDDNGEFDKEGLPGDVFEYELHFDNGLAMTVPNDGGRISIPKDPRKRVPIYVGAPKDKQFWDDVSKKINELSLLYKNNSARADSSILDYAIQEAKRQKVFLQKAQLEYALGLQREKERSARGRREAIYAITTALDPFISRSLDLKDEFGFNGRRSLEDERARVQLSAKIDSYSVAYEQLNKNREKIIKMVEDYWENEHRSTDVRSLLEYALDDFHKTTMLRSNLLLEDIREFDEKVQGRKSKRRAIENELEKIIFDIQVKTGNLESRKTRVVQVLKDAKYNVSLFPGD